MRIHKYELKSVSMQEVMIPMGAKILSVVNQRESIMVYAMVDVHAPDAPMTFWVEPTGWEIGEAADARFLGTVVLAGGTSVYHVFVKEASA